MREIKFRVYNDRQGYMAQVDTLYLEELADPDSRPVNMHYMQYTGLKDKNGVEIYEGDIVTDSQISTPQVVYFREGAFMIGHRGEETQYDKASKLWGDYCEVIGNIYENSELLEK